MTFLGPVPGGPADPPGDLLARMSRLAKVGGWSFDPRTGAGEWTDEVARIHDLDPADPTTKELGLSFYTPDSRPRIEQAVREAIELARPYDLELELVSAKGARKWVRTQGQPVVEGGRVVWVQGTFQDITEQKRVERALRESQAHLGLFIEHAPAALAMFDREMRYLAASRRWLADYRLEGREVLGVYQYDLFPQLPEAARAIHRRALAGEAVRIEEDRFIFADGTVRWRRWEVHPWRDAGGSIGGIVLFSEDLTRRKRSESALRETEDRLQLFIEHAPAALAMFGRDMRYLAVSRRWLTDYGLEGAEVLGRSHYDIFPEITEAWKAVHRRGLAGEVIVAEEDCFERQDGEVQWLRWEVRPWFEADGTVGGIVIFSEDITARKRSEQALRNSEHRMRLFIEHAPAALAMFDREMRYLAVSRSWLSGFGLEEADILGRSHYEVFPEITEAWKEVHRRGLAGEVITADKDRFERRDGSVQWVRWEVRPWYEDDGGIGGITMIHQDITARVLAQEALGEREATIRNLFDNMVEGFAHCRVKVENGRPVDWEYLSVNGAYGRITGLGKIEGKWLSEVLPGLREGNPELFDALCRVALEGGTARMEPFIRPMGVWFSVKAYQPAPGEFAVVLEDITARKQALLDLEASEARRRESEERFATAFAENPAAIVLSRLGDGLLLDVNARWEALTGFGREEVIGGSVRDLGVWPSEAEAGRFVRELLERGVIRGWEQAFRRKDGTSFISQLAAQVLSIKGEPHILSTLVDITAQKRAQEEILRLNAELEDRVEARTTELRAANAELEAFAYAVSHDLRAPLRAMSGFSQALEEDFGPDLPPEARKYLAQIQTGSHRMGELIDGLLTLSRSTRGDLDREPVDLTALAEDVRGQLERAEPGRQVRWHLQPGLRAAGDSRMLQAVLANLLGNAWKYTAGRDPAEIRFDTVEEDGASWFRVADNGAGFDMAYAAKLFQPFQRLHRQDEFQGLGIGLATVQRIILRHGGRIRAKAEPGRGATFLFSLPGHLTERSS